MTYYHVNGIGRNIILITVLHQCRVKNILYTMLILRMLINPSNAEGYFHPKHKDGKISEKHRNPIMLVFIAKLSQSTLR